MKKAVKKIISLLLCVCMLLGISFVVSSCADGMGSDPYLDEEHIVYSNGGNCVVYDGTLYYINGVPNYTDKLGKTNIEGEVIKGGLYSAKLVKERKTEAELIASEGESYQENSSSTINHVADYEYKCYSPLELGHYTIGDGEDIDAVTEALNTETGKVEKTQNIVYTDEKYEYRVATEPVVQKKIGTSDYKGGIYIFDGKIYFATPCNKKSSDGVYEYEKAEFYCYDIETGSLNLLYTTEEENASIPYVFIKQNGRVYLITFENYYKDSHDEDYDINTGFIISNAIENGRVTSKEVIAEGIDEVYFPEVTTYNPAKEKERSYIKADDFIYYTKQEEKDANASASAKANTYTIGMISPSGKYSSVVADNLNRQPKIKGVAGNYFYYITTSLNSKEELKVTNLKAQFKEIGFDYSDVSWEGKEHPALKDMTETEQTLIADMSAYDDVILMADSEDYDPTEQEEVQVIAYKGSYVYRIAAGSVTTIWNSGSDFQVMAYYDGMVYGLTGEFVASISSYSTMSGDANFKLLNVGLTSTYTYAESNWGFDFYPVTYKYNGETVTEKYISYMAGYTDNATHYMVVKKISGHVALNAPCIEISEIKIDEKDKITCYDVNCINWNHDHSNWDSLETLTEEEQENLEAQEESENA